MSTTQDRQWEDVSLDKTRELIIQASRHPRHESAFVRCDEYYIEGADGGFIYCWASALTISSEHVEALEEAPDGSYVDMMMFFPKNMVPNCKIYREVPETEKAMVKLRLYIKSVDLVMVSQWRAHGDGRQPERIFKNTGYVKSE